MLEQLDMFASRRSVVDFKSSSNKLMGFQDLLPAHINAVLSPRLKNSWYIQFSPGKSESKLSLPAILELAPEKVKAELISWARLMETPKRRWTAVQKKQRGDWENSIRAFLENPEVSSIDMYSLSDSQKEILRRWKKKPKGRQRRVNSVGVIHDLREVFQEINSHYFQGKLEVTITWSGKLGGLSTHSLQKDPSGKSYHLITISQGYNAKNVSREILGGVVYHECLHAALPPKVVRGRRVVHGPDFRKREREYEFYKEWIYWHKTQLGKNLRTLRWKKSMGLWREKIFKRISP